VTNVRNRKAPPRSDGAVRSLARGMWPPYGEHDPLGYDAARAFNEIFSIRSLNMQSGEYERSRRAGVRPLLSITCDPDRHDHGVAPMIAELWNTSYGLLFASKLSGAIDDPDDDLTDPLAPPTAVLPAWMRSERTQPYPGRRRADDEWTPIPVTIVRVLLGRPPIP
jgi:hypothetical protein